MAVADADADAEGRTTDGKLQDAKLCDSSQSEGLQCAGPGRAKECLTFSAGCQVGCGQANLASRKGLGSGY